MIRETCALTGHDGRGVTHIRARPRRATDPLCQKCMEPRFAARYHLSKMTGLAGGHPRSEIGHLDETNPLDIT